jgi:ABC-2 type transport system permease protein
MTKATLDADLPGPSRPEPWAPMPLERRGVLSALRTLFRLSVDRQCRTRRVLMILFLFSLPVAFAILARAYNPDTVDAGELEIGLVFYFIPHALVPLTALMYASGMIQDEVEEQTLTYLLVRPLPKWAIYTCKLLATFAVACVLVGVFTFATYAAIYWGSEQFWGEILAARAPKTITLIALSLLAYCSLFGLVSLFVRRSLTVGVAYIVLFEGVFASLDFVVRWLTVMFYFRVLSERWLDLRPPDWSINLDTAPDALTCVLVLLGISLVTTVLAAVTFTVREFRVKTPEGN